MSSREGRSEASGSWVGWVSVSWVSVPWVSGSRMGSAAGPEAD